MSVQPAARKLLLALVPILPRWGRWYVFGAQAVVAYGVPRLSADVDVTIKLTPENPEAFIREMDAAGFATRTVDAGFIMRTRVIPFVHRDTAMPLDVVMAGSALEDEFLSRARLIDLDGVAVPFLDPEDLIIVKILAGRPKDRDDAVALWRGHGHALDATRIRTVLRELEDGLGRSDLVPVFETMLRTP